jgi:hypothetical protein
MLRRVNGVVLSPCVMVFDSGGRRICNGSLKTAKNGKLLVGENAW